MVSFSLFFLLCIKFRSVSRHPVPPNNKKCLFKKLSLLKKGSKNWPKCNLLSWNLPQNQTEKRARYPMIILNPPSKHNPNLIWDTTSFFNLIQVIYKSKDRKRSHSGWGERKVIIIIVPCVAYRKGNCYHTIKST